MTSASSLDCLDRPIWAALNTDHAALAQNHGALRTYPASLAPFAATGDDSAQSLDALAQWPAEERSLLFLQATQAVIPANWLVEMQAKAVQMVLTSALPTQEPTALDTTISRLGPDDAEAMLALATLTKPGPFSLRSQELGPFWGVKRNGTLIAMGGTRLRANPYVEVSGLCTLPQMQGQGLGRAMLHFVTAQVIAAGQIPFLHAYADNTHAIRLYQSLGFQIRSPMVVTLARPNGTARHELGS